MAELSIGQTPIAPALTAQYFQIPVFRNQIPERDSTRHQVAADGTLDINSFMVGRAGATSYFFDVKTNAFADDGILAGDMVLVDTAGAAAQGDLVVAEVGDLYKLLRVFNPEAHQVWGVVTGVIRKMHNNRA